MPGPAIERLDARAFTIPTDGPESDGTLAWSETTIVVATAAAGGRLGLGYTYSHAAAARVITDTLASIVVGLDPMSVGAAWRAMVRAVRNIGRPGLVSSAISAVDVALWDLKARLLQVPLTALFGAARDRVPLYGSGGFTSYSTARLQEQLGRWARQGFDRVKMKVGRDPAADPARVAAAREAIGPDVALFVDANGAYSIAQAIGQAEAFARRGVVWFEEPVSSDDLEGLRAVRSRAPAGMAVAAGEYGYAPADFERLLAAGAVDVLQADATRCGGYTGFLDVAAICEARSMPLSAHTAPNLHAHVCCAARPVIHLEYFHDHVRIEDRLFDGALVPADGCLVPDRSVVGHGLALRRADAERYAA